MISSVIFLNDHWAWPAGIAAILLFAVFLWKDWSQSGKQRFIPKVLLAFLAITALALIALKPALPTEKTLETIVLITEGFQPEKLDSLKKENGRIKQVEYFPGEPLPKDLRAAEKVFVLGNGVKEYDLWQLDDVPAIFLKGKVAKGVVKLKYEQEQQVGDELFLKGMYRNSLTKKQLFLHGPGETALDSITLNVKEEQSFQLSTKLKVAGNYVYSLVEKDSQGEILTSNPLPVRISEKQNLKILMVNSFPTFETKYLKNFLAETGHEVIIRSQITRGRFKFEYFNTDRIAINTLSETILETFDLLIIDAANLRTLSGNQINAIENTIQNKGLGLVIQADDSFFNSSGQLYPFKYDRINTTEITGPELPGIKLTRFPYQVRYDFMLQPIHSVRNSVVSFYKRTGEGRIGTTVLRDSWQLILDGKNREYQEIWSQVVEQISKEQNPTAQLQQEEWIAFNDEPFHFKIRTTSTSPTIKSTSGNIPLIQHPIFPEMWEGTTWPRELGWNKINLDTIDTFDFYVAEENQWGSLTAFNTQQVNRKYFNRPINTGRGQQPLEPINPFWFFLVFLLCIGILWLEPKL